MFLSNRFFQIFGAVTALFALAFPFAWLFPIAKTALALALALAGTDFALLYLRRPKLKCRRELNPIFSLSDPNPVEIYVENQHNMRLKMKVLDELPEQFQRRDFEIALTLG
ncbi:MAG: DUF58 domain-containing protein, partial [Bacteroidota bacterium]